MKTPRTIVRELYTYLETWVLNSLRETHAYQKGTLYSRPVTVGEVVILKDDATKKMYWKSAVVEELISGWDGQIINAII